jgi:hypothetical protein
VKSAWGKIYGIPSANTSTASSIENTCSSSSIVGAVSELSMYTDSDPITVFDDDFDILSW